MRLKDIAIGIFLAGFTAGVCADEPVKRHGAVIGHEPGVRFEGGLTVSLQRSSDHRAKSEALASLDLLTTIPTSSGSWTIYIEGNVSPRDNGVSSMIGEANGDAGSALNSHGNGRFQLSEIHYMFPWGEGNRTTIGLINPACVLDSSEVANDETSQFLGTSFVNNPTIAFPDYALGACTHFNESKDTPGFNLLLTSSHGIGDNDDASYSDLIDIDDDGKGVFIAGEFYKTSEQGLWRAGIWASTADNDYLDGSGRTDNNYGAYLTVDHKVDETNWNFRLGFAHDEVSEAAGFIGVAMQTPFAGHTLGAGLSRTYASSKIGPGTDDTTHAEIYLRYDVNDELHITPSIQWVKNSGFDDTGINHDETQTVIGARVSYTF